MATGRAFMTRARDPRQYIVIAAWCKVRALMFPMTSPLGSSFLILATLVSLDARAAEPGWREHDSTTIEATLPTLAEGQLLIVEVSADWCTPCHALHNEVLATPRADDVVGPDVAVVLDFDSDYGQRVKREHGIVGIPSTLVFDRTGTERGRVEGYVGPDDYIAAVRDAKAGRLGLAAAEAKVKADPRDLEAKIELAQAHLIHGQEALGLRELSAIIKADKSKDGDFAFRAAGAKGRWLLRVKEDGPAAIVHYRAMFERFAGTPHEPPILYWYASALAKTGHGELGVALFDAWIARAPTSSDARQLKADFMVQSGYAPAETEAYVRSLVATSPEVAELHYFLSRLREKADDMAAARAEADEALRLEPGEAIYQNRAAQLSALR